jgi:hypothetical protein
LVVLTLRRVGDDQVVLLVEAPSSVDGAPA